jgi:hypothetical protein
LTGHPWWRESFNPIAKANKSLKRAMDVLNTDGVCANLTGILQKKEHIQLTQIHSALYVTPMTPDDVEDVYDTLKTLRRNLKKTLSQTNRKAELEHWQRIRDSFQKQGTPSDMSRFIANKATSRFRTKSSVQNC